MPIVLLRRGAWSAIASAAATAGGLVLLSGLVFGWDYWITYLTETSALQARMVAESSGFFVRMMPTVYPSMLLAGLGWSGAVAVQAVVAIAAIAALWRWLPADPLRAGLAAASATFLVLPYAFNYDMTVIGMAALIALYRTAPDASPVARYAPVLAFLLPLLVVFLNQAGVPAAPFVLALFLAVQLAEGRQAAVTPPRLLQPA
jgi:alpha-1,2-mannosyltransferase